MPNPAIRRHRTYAQDGTSWDPSMLSGLSLWFDFSDGATLFTDTARTIPVSASGDQLAGVTDKSGNGNHGSTAASAADYEPGIQNGLSTAQFTAAASEFISFPAISFTGGIYAAWAGKLSSTPSTYTVLGHTGTRRLWRFETVNQYAYRGDANTFKAVGGMVPQFDLLFHAYELLVTSSGTLQMYIDGEAVATEATGADTAVNFSRIGTRGGLDFLDAHVGEIILGPGSVTSGERASLLSYFSSKWAI